MFRRSLFSTVFVALLVSSVLQGHSEALLSRGPADREATASDDFMQGFWVGCRAGLPAGLAIVAAWVGRSLYSVDAEAANKLKCWHEKRDGEYFWSDDRYTSDGRRMSEVRATFPKNDLYSQERLVKAILLAKHNRLRKMAAVAVDPLGGESKVVSRDADYETTWNQQPLRDRFWWTIRYRTPTAWGSSIVGQTRAAFAGIGQRFSH